MLILLNYEILIEKKDDAHVRKKIICSQINRNEIENICLFIDVHQTSCSRGFILLIVI